MQLLVTTEQRYFQIPDGSIWSMGALSYEFWLRYTDVFEEVVVLARALPVSRLPGDMVRSDGPSVQIVPIPHYIGPFEFLRVARKVHLNIKNAIIPISAVIIRAPSLIGTIVENRIIKDKRPFGVEAIGDPDQVFLSDPIRQPLNSLFRLWFRNSQKRQCRNAIGVAYVTERYLQNKYPCKKLEASVADVDLNDSWALDKQKGFVSSYSSVELKTQDYRKEINIRPQIGRRTRLILVGSLEQLYKGPDLAIRALALLARENRNIELVIVGGGKYIKLLKGIAEAEGVSELVKFKGGLPTPDDVRNELDEADLFIMPSRTEGLPRAMIEAMARGLPCIGTDVGGIPELLPPDDMVCRGDFRALAQRIKEVLSSSTRMQAMGARNVLKAREFHSDILRLRRNAFYRQICAITEEWYRKNIGCARFI